MTELAANHPQGHTKAEERLLFIACFVSLVATSFAFIIRVMLMDDWQIAFGLSETEKGQIFGAGMWPFGLSIVLFSLVIDRVGYGKSMIFAFVCHAASAVLMMTANGYWPLYFGSILNGLAAGTVEAVINPAVASMYPKKKTTMLTILHAGWPAGFVLGGATLLLAGDALSWNVKAGVILIPVVLYALLLLKARFPVSERVVAGVSYKDMLKEAGAVGWLIVVYMITSEVNNVLGGFGLFKEGGYLFEQFGWTQYLWQTPIFTLPSLPMTILMGVLVAGYLLYTKSLGRSMYIFLLIIMILLAITELSTDNWIKDLMKPAMSKLGINSGWVIVYTATIMMVLRFCISPIEKLLRPLGVLFVSSLFAAAGLYLLSGAEGGLILLFATIYGIGQCFFWPVTLGLVAERFPRGGALTLNAMGGVGMLGAGIIGNQLMGFWQDRRIDSELQDRPAYVRLMKAEDKTSIFGKYRPLDTDQENAINYKAALYEQRLEAAKTAKLEPATQIAVTVPTNDELWKQLKDDGAYQVAVQRAFNLLVRPKDDSREYSLEEMQKAIEEKGVVVGPEQYDDLKADQELINDARTVGKRQALSRVSILPLIMACCYLGLIIYFKVRYGGYKVVDLSAEGEVVGQHKPTVKEAVADAEQTPSE